MATPTRAAPWAGLKIPNGRFWIGKCESGGTSIKDFISGRFGEIPTLQEFQHPQILPRLIKAAAAKGGNQLAQLRNAASWNLPFTPGEAFLGKRERIRRFILEHLGGLFLAPVMFRRQHARTENIQEAVHLRLHALVKQAH